MNFARFFGPVLTFGNSNNPENHLEIQGNRLNVLYAVFMSVDMSCMLFLCKLLFIEMNLKFHDF